MSFLQNFHLSPGQTIRSTRGFKWNAGGNGTSKNTGLFNKTKNEQGINVSPERDAKNPINAVYADHHPSKDPALYATPKKQHQQVVTDFNYTPSHQQPYIQPQAGTTVTTHQDIKEIVEMTLGSEGVLNQAVKLPRGEDENEWLAVHCVDFYNQINMLYGTITEFCSPQTCPRMIATNEYEYLWSFDKNQPPTSVSAPKYVEALMKWCQDQFDDEYIFPSKSSGNFPPDFISRHIIPILRRLFRVYAHIYCHHFNEILELNLQTVLNTSFRHFCLFAQEFQLLRAADFGPLLELVNEFKSR